MTQGDLMEWAETRRDEIIAAHADACGAWAEDAAKAVLAVLRRDGEATGEELVDAVKAEGWVPRDDRAFGAVFQRLAKRGLIERRGYAPRRKGHATAGAILWGIR